MLEKILNNFRPAFPERLFKYALVAIVLVSILLPLSIYWGLLRIPTIELLNGMAWQPKFKTQSINPYLPMGVTTQPPVKRTIPRGYLAYPYAGNPEAAAQMLRNPLPPTMANLQRGEKIYDTFCQPCHGFKGKAMGSAVGPGRLPNPLPLITQKTIDYTDGMIYHVITEGQNTMPGYATQVKPMDRWAAVHYVRVLQRAANPKPEDLPPSESEDEDDEEEETEEDEGSDEEEDDPDEEDEE